MNRGWLFGGVVCLAASAAGCREPLVCEARTRACGELCCPAPAHGVATCDGAVCGFTCEAGFHRAGGACASDTSVTSCGPLGADCTSGLTAHASPTCDGIACGFECQSGRHKAGGECVDDETLTSCGSSGINCTMQSIPSDSTATCSGSPAVCGFDCNSGFHETGPTCSANTTVTSCGESGTDCTSKLAPHATATCDGTTCGFDCNSDYHQTGSTCTADTEVSSCGAAARDCNTEVPLFATPTCDGTACDFACLQDHHQTGGSCTVDTDPTSCGESASDCRSGTPANASATCDGTTCGFECSQNFCASGGGCVAKQTCSAQGFNCGTIDDGCGSTEVCGTCTPPALCGKSNVCSDPIYALWPVPDSTSELCTIGSEFGACPPAGDPLYGQDGSYVMNKPTYNVTADTVLDSVTGLMWQRVATTTKYTWSEAITYCNDLFFADHRDWRLPTRIELLSIFDAPRHDPAIHPVFGGGGTEGATQPVFHWSSSQRAADPSTAWGMSFSPGYGGPTTYGSKSGTYVVRCVRSGGGG